MSGKALMSTLLLAALIVTGCLGGPTETPTPAPTPTATPMPEPPPTATPTPTPVTPAQVAPTTPRPPDLGWLGSDGDPGRTRFNPGADPGAASTIWQLAFEPLGDTAITAVEVIATPEVVFVVDSAGRVHRVDARSGERQLTTAIWPYGPRGSVPGAALALTEDVLIVSATDTYMSTEARLPFFRGKLVALDAGQLTRLWELPGQFGHDYQFIAQHGQLAVTTDEHLVSLFDAHSGQAIWTLSDPLYALRVLAATRDTLYVRAASTAPPEQRGPFDQRQRFLAIDWASGEVLWDVRPSLEDDVIRGLTDGDRLFLVTAQNRALALDIRTGEELWRVEQGPTAAQSPVATGYELLIGVQPEIGSVIALDVATGEKAWETPLTGTWSVPALGLAGDKVYLSEMEDGRFKLAILDARTGQPIPSPGAVSALSTLITPYPGMAAAGDRLYIAGDDLRALGEMSPVAPPTAIAPPDWPLQIIPSDLLLYESTVTGDGEIWAQPADGASEPENWTHNGANDWDPAPAPGGDRVAFESYRSGASNIWIMGFGGDDPRALTDSEDPTSYHVHPTWSPDGEWVAFASDRQGLMQIWVTRRDGSELRQLTSEGKNWDPAWSPDGSMIAFVSDREGVPDIWIMAPDGSGQRPWRRTAEMEGQPAWSPGCAEDLMGPTCAIAFVRRVDEDSDWGELRARLFNGSLEWSIPGTSWGFDRGLTWWPRCAALGSDCWIAWGRLAEQNRFQLMVGDMDGSVLRTVGDGKDPAWLVRP